jgi:uncharacterized protein YdeI (YjbR/CyaY-like superfamily)
MGQFGQIRSLKDLPGDKIMAAYIKEAMALVDKGVKLTKKDIVSPTSVEIPDYFLKELKKNKTAFANFDKSSPSHKKEYVMWITEAKTDETRNKRMATAIEWIAEGKQRNWKYMKQ